MDRFILHFLTKWLNSENRLPLVLRGARQVGKTWTVRELAKQTNKQLIEFNFEKNPNHKTLFNSNDVNQVMLNIESLKETVINSQSILFLDEIQAAPELLSKLRWFAEDAPDLAVIATGSLLDFTLAKYQYSMPVGRINCVHLEPLSFEEFLMAYKIIQRIYYCWGGLPRAVSSWVSNNSLTELNKIHHDFSLISGEM